MYRSLVRALDRSSRGVAALLVGAGLAGVAGLDVATGSELSFSIFYLLPVAIGTLRFGRRAGHGLSLLAAGIWTVVEYETGRAYSTPWLPLWNGMVRCGFFLIVSSLLAELRALLDVASDAARTDPLTRLLNRRGFVEAAARELERARRRGEPIAFAYLDLDDFKRVNDQLGHDAGDALLRSVAGACRRSLRAIDLAARLGGDEFAFCLPGASTPGVRVALERLRAGLQARGLGPGPRPRFSMGVVEFSVPPPSVEAALLRVDALMYEAKGRGKDVTLYASDAGAAPSAPRGPCARPAAPLEQAARGR